MASNAEMVVVYAECARVNRGADWAAFLDEAIRESWVITYEVEEHWCGLVGGDVPTAEIDLESLRDYVVAWLTSCGADVLALDQPRVGS